MKATVTLAVLALATGCSSTSSDTDAVVDNGLAVSDVWTRPTPAGASETAVYFTIENRDAPDDRWIGAESDRCMVMSPHLTEIDDRGVATMNEATGDQLAVTADRPLRLEPNGLHLMCLGLAESLAVGDTFDIELRFAEHTPFTVTANVLDRVD